MYKALHGRPGNEASNPHTIINIHVGDYYAITKMAAGEQPKSMMHGVAQRKLARSLNLTPSKYFLANIFFNDVL